MCLLTRRCSTRSCASLIRQSHLWEVSISASGGAFPDSSSIVADHTRWAGGIPHNTPSLMTLRKARRRFGQVLLSLRSTRHELSADGLTGKDYSNARIADFHTLTKPGE